MEQYAVRDGGPVEAWSWEGFCITNEWLTLLLSFNSFLQSWIYIQGHWGSWLLQLYAVNTVDSISYRRWGPYVNWCSLTCVQPWVPTWFIHNQKPEFQEGKTSLYDESSGIFIEKLDEWGLIHFSVQLCATLWTAACQASLSVGILPTRILEWVAMPSSNFVNTVSQLFKSHMRH